MNLKIKIFEWTNELTQNRLIPFKHIGLINQNMRDLLEPSLSFNNPINS